MDASPSKLKVGLVAGEHSGDTLGAGLMQALKATHPECEFMGVGGEKMRAAGLLCWEDAEALAVMGLTEVLKHLPRLLRLRKSLVEQFVAARPDVFVGIDAPDFNLGLAKRLRRRGLRTVQYVSPSVWAWREGRVKTIAKACDHVLCLLPFEPEFYEKHHVAATFVGHPLAQDIQPVGDVTVPRRQLGIDPDKPVLTVLPGSRRGEISRLGADFAAAARLTQQRIGNLQVCVPLASASGEAAFREVAGEAIEQGKFRLSIGDADRCMAASDALLLASGTATLEGLLHGKPMVVGYRVAPSTSRIVRTFNLIKLTHFSLPNLLTTEPMVPEFVQDALTPEAASEALLPWFEDNPKRAALLAAFEQVRTRLAVNANARAAKVVSELAREHAK
ncbi:MAG: lipid-A-disaccharide synthase [Pseudomonadota bacterium]